MIKSPKAIAVIFLLLLLNSISLGDDLPVEARRLVDQRDEAIQRINEKLTQELEKVKVTYTKRGDLVKANAVADLIARVKTSKPLRLVDFSGVWSRSVGGNTTLHKNGQVSTDWSISSRTWRKISENSIGITYKGNELVWTLKAGTQTLLSPKATVTMTRKK